VTEAGRESAVTDFPSVLSLATTTTTMASTAAAPDSMLELSPSEIWAPPPSLPTTAATAAGIGLELFKQRPQSKAARTVERALSGSGTLPVCPRVDAF